MTPRLQISAGRGAPRAEMWNLGTASLGMGRAFSYPKISMEMGKGTSYLSTYFFLKYKVLEFARLAKI